MKEYACCELNKGFVLGGVSEDERLSVCLFVCRFFSFMIGLVVRLFVVCFFGCLWRLQATARRETRLCVACLVFTQTGRVSMRRNGRRRLPTFPATTTLRQISCVALGVFFSSRVLLGSRQGNGGLGAPEGGVGCSLRKCIGSLNRAGRWSEATAMKTTGSSSSSSWLVLVSSSCWIEVAETEQQSTGARRELKDRVAAR